MGVPLPNTWLGGPKDIDLIQEFGSDPGFRKGFADGVAAIKVRNGSLRIVLKKPPPSLDQKDAGHRSHRHPHPGILFTPITPPFPFPDCTSGKTT
jgi:hypothetical protein